MNILTQVLIMAIVEVVVFMQIYFINKRLNNGQLSFKQYCNNKYFATMYLFGLVSYFIIPVKIIFIILTVAVAMYCENKILNSKSIA